MNKLTITGRLTKDPVIYRNNKNQNMAKFTLAVRRPRAKEGQATADFVRCTAFRSVDFIDRYLRKGTKIEVVGSIRTGSYIDRDGKTVYTTEMLVDEIEFAESLRAD